MTWKDKLEIGLKEDAGYRKDNLPLFQVRGPETSTGPGRSAEVTAARRDTTGRPDAPAAGALPDEQADGSPKRDTVNPDESAPGAMSDEGGPPPAGD